MAIARRSKQPFETAFAPTSADQHIAAGNRSRLQLPLRPSCSHWPSARFRMRIQPILWRLCWSNGRPVVAVIRPSHSKLPSPNQALDKR